MPAIQVARTDTFEQQRQKINQLGSTLFNITAGGSDLSTGNLKLGDGTRTAPSLSFVSDPGLGIYKPDEKIIGYVSDGKKIADFAPTGFYSFRDFIVQRKVLTTAGTSILNNGKNYDPGTYTNIPISGGTGENATINVIVTEYSGTLLNSGSNYTPGTYNNIPLSGGTGSGALVSFIVDSLSGVISNSGSGYVPGLYTNIPLTGGSGTGALASISITGSTTLNGSITSGGTGYTTGTYNSIQILNTPTTTYTVTTTTNASPPPNEVYRINGVTQQSLTLIRGNTYRFDQSAASNAGHPITFVSSTDGPLSPQDYTIISKGNAGSAGAFTDLIIKPTAATGSIKYSCSIHSGMGASITINSGVSGRYGSGASANITVSGGAITAFSFVSSGSDYKSGDTLQVYVGDVGNTGSEFQYTLSTPTYTGVISTISISNSGNSYLLNDILSFNNSSVGGFGSGFQYTISSNPGKIGSLSFPVKGSGYSINDLLSLPSGVSGISANLRGTVNDLTTTLSTASTTITVSSTAGIIPGMQLNVAQGSIGVLSPGTTVSSITNSTQLVLSALPTTSGSATVTFFSTNSLTDVLVSSTTNIVPGLVVSKTSGSGTISAGTTVVSVNSSTSIVTLSSAPTSPGVCTLSFLPSYGVGTTSFSYRIDTLGPIQSFTVNNSGNGYTVNDQLTVDSTNLTQPITYLVRIDLIQTLVFQSTLPSNTFTVGDFVTKRSGQIQSFSETTKPTVSPTTVGPRATTLSTSSTTITVSNTTGITSGMIVSQDLQNDIGELAVPTTVQTVVNSTQLVLSALPIASGTANLTFSSDQSGIYTNISSTTNGSGTGATFDITRSQSGVVTNISINNSGYFYAINDTITISGNTIGGTTPTHDIVLTISSVIPNIDLEILKINSSGGNITSMVIKSIVGSTIIDSDYIVKSTTNATSYQLSSASAVENKYLINTGSGFSLTPNLSLYVGNTYVFDFSNSTNIGNTFSLSKYRDGKWSPSFISNISTTLSTTSSQITVSNTTGILPGMEVSVVSGTGAVIFGTTVLSVNNLTTLTLSSTALTSGPCVLNFRGSEYTAGVTRSSTTLKIKVTLDTPNLYYYSADSENYGGSDNLESSISINSNNPKYLDLNFCYLLFQFLRQILFLRMFLLELLMPHL